MSKLFLSMLIGAGILMMTTEDSKDSLSSTVRSIALAVAEAVQR